MTQLGLVIETLGRSVSSAIPFAQERAWGWHPMWVFWGPWGLTLMLMMLVFWAVVLVSIVAGIRWLVRQGQGSHTDPALDILRPRYARGEINRDEFETKRRDLVS